MVTLILFALGIVLQYPAASTESWGVCHHDQCVNKCQEYGCLYAKCKDLYCLCGKCGQTIASVLDYKNQRVCDQVFSKEQCERLLTDCSNDECTSLCTHLLCNIATCEPSLYLDYDTNTKLSSCTCDECLLGMSTEESSQAINVQVSAEHATTQEPTTTDGIEATTSNNMRMVQPPAQKPRSISFNMTQFAIQLQYNF
ncbi:hypothetical protein PPYR_03971 [Photinus pyralis]|uniref:Uncharacterized protein n=1 Tax=Photinus pyralis TaxID=7054 RepID=A0A1Y1KP51_PHOPY|nr:uncharacterized protein LOC116163759 [Photinus pyralis]KAB0801785.1 hypothetical protein PPYR_03971 [Photinus pyralis]